MGQTQLDCGLITQDYQDEAWHTHLNSGMEKFNANIIKTYDGDPNGFVTGKWLGRTVFDTVNKINWICTALGTAATSQWQPQGVPIGSILPFIVYPLPVGYLRCDGSTYADTDYPLLYELAPIEWKQVANTLTLPDLFGFTLMGGATGVNLGKTFGTNQTGAGEGDHDHGGQTDEHILTYDEMPSHAHAYQGAGGGGANQWQPGTIQGVLTGVTSTEGGDQPHSHGISGAGDHIHTLDPQNIKVIFGVRAS